jgi:rhodanese-related sulfurtransferase
MFVQSSISRIIARRWIVAQFSAIALLVPALAAVGCATTPAASPPNIFDGTLRDSEKTPEISTSELQAALKDPSVVVLDARAPEEFAVSHLPGARNVPGKPGLSPSRYTADIRAVFALVPDKARPLILYCNGPFCGRSKRLAAELVQAGYSHVRRYQLGIPTWRAIGGATQVERDAVIRLLSQDQTAVLVDARDTKGVGPRLRDARSIPLSDTIKAKDDGRLPMADHATRIFVIGENGAQARAVAEAIFRDAFHNVSFFDGAPADLPELAAKEPGPNQADPSLR